MSESPPPISVPAQPAQPGNESTSAELTAESFLGVVIRRTRYVVAMLLSAWLFCTVGWQVARPPADWGGVSLMVWWGGAGGGGASHPLVAGLVLAGLLVIATGISALLVHPDTPHMGLCCALMGMAGLSIRGGTIYMLIRHAELRELGGGETYARDFRMMAIEAILWGIVLVVAERFARALHDRFFANVRWLTRTGVDLAKGPPKSETLGTAIWVAKRVGTLNLPRVAAMVLAFVVNAVLGALVLFLVLQAQSKGQALFGCFAAFFVSTLLVYYAFPRVPAAALFLSVPAAAAAGYWLTAGYAIVYPGHAGLYFGNALPIDYMSAGVPGAIFGYYLALHWDLHSRVAENA